MKKLRNFFIFGGFKNEIFIVMFYYFFSSQKCHNFCHWSKTLYIFIFLCVYITFFLINAQYIFLDVFHYFGHHGRPASQIFNPRLSFDYFNQAIILIQKKLRFWRFKVWFGTKAPKIGDFGHLNFMFGY